MVSLSTLTSGDLEFGFDVGCYAGITWMQLSPALVPTCSGARAFKDTRPTPTPSLT